MRSMRADPGEIARYLCCPDDGAELAARAGGLRCVHCSRDFVFLRPNLVEILPSRPIAISDSDIPRAYGNAYVQAYSEVREALNEETTWGAPESLTAKAARSRERQSEEALRLLFNGGGADGVFCDLSAGAGLTTFAAARNARLVFHCDLSVAAVGYASTAATRMALDNMVVVRADYFRPPFRGSIQRLTCLDSLIRGPGHDVRLLESIRWALAPDGSAVVDFHNWWHNPLRRLGLLRQNFGENRSYTREEVLKLLAQAGIDDFMIRAFVQESDGRSLPGKMLARVMPATRFVVRFMADKSAV
jgi:SAM-dependent methyltransferase